MTTEMTDRDYAIADLIEAQMEEAPNGVTPSQAARAAKTDTVTARRVLQWMVGSQYAHTAGNGAWTRYHAGRAA